MYYDKKYFVCLRESKYLHVKFNWKRTVQRISCKSVTDRRQSNFRIFNISMGKLRFIVTVHTPYYHTSVHRCVNECIGKTLRKYQPYLPPVCLDWYATVAAIAQELNLPIFVEDFSSRSNNTSLHCRVHFPIRVTFNLLLNRTYLSSILSLRVVLLFLVHKRTGQVTSLPKSMVTFNIKKPKYIANLWRGVSSSPVVCIGRVRHICIYVYLWHTLIAQSGTSCISLYLHCASLNKRVESKETM